MFEWRFSNDMKCVCTVDLQPIKYMGGKIEVDYHINNERQRERESETLLLKKRKDRGSVRARMRIRAMHK